MMNHFLSSLTLLATLIMSVPLARTTSASDQVAEIGYSFQNGKAGGVAVAQIDTTSGKILDSKVLFESPDCRQPLKVRQTANQEYIVTNIDEDNPSIFITGNAKKLRQIELPTIPDDLQIADNQGLVTCDKDIIVAFDIERAKIIRSWDVGKLYRPRANGPESIFISSDKKYAVISFQKDNKTGKERGNRLGVYELPKMIQVADLQLPRDRKELHIEGNKKEQGPGPEVVIVSDNTLSVTLDLYGAVGFMDWQAAIGNKIKNWSAVPTSLDGQWGIAFPDRVRKIQFGTHTTLLVFNAGVDGGAVLISPKQRRVLWKRPVPPGLERAIYLPKQRMAFSVCSGKTKTRRTSAIEKTYAPQPYLFAFDFSSSQAFAEAPVEKIELTDKFAIKISRVSPGSNLLLIAVGTKAQQPDELITYDPLKRKILDRQPIVGILGRFEI